MSAPNKSLRLPDALVERLEAYAKANGIKFSAAVRIVLQRGIAEFEREAEPKAPALMQRRRIISKGVGY